MGRHSPPKSRTGRRSGIAAIVAQGTQAATGLVIQVLAARSLGAAGLGEFGVLYGTLVLATAISSGFVGDSMTVLDRHELSVRAALQNWLVLISVVCAAACFLVTWVTSFVDFRAAMAFGIATFVFLIEDAVRRLLMATLMFWRIVIVDMTGLLAMVAFLAFAPAVSVGGLFLALTVSVGGLFLALAVGQLSAIAVGICVLPDRERWLARPLPAQHRAIAAYGAWRSLQLVVQPSLLALTRVTVVVLVGLAAAGEMEAARIYAAPAMLTVYGLGTYMLASHAVAKDRPIQTALRLADKQVLTLVLIVIVFSIGAVAAVPLIGPLITGYDISTVAIIGWLAYTLSVAVGAPYGALAAVHGMQATVLVVLVAHSTLSLALAAASAYVFGSFGWVPFGLAIGSFVGALALRQYVLRPKRHSNWRARAEVESS
jgi:O-antigen/teichoic acid export membrane protein